MSILFYSHAFLASDGLQGLYLCAEALPTKLSMIKPAGHTDPTNGRCGSISLASVRITGVSANPYHSMNQENTTNTFVAFRCFQELSALLSCKKPLDLMSLHGQGFAECLQTLFPRQTRVKEVQKQPSSQHHEQDLIRFCFLAGR